MSNYIELPPDPALEREAFLDDKEAIMMPEPFSLSVRGWLKDHGFDMKRPIQRRRLEYRSGELFLQFSDNRHSIHNI